MQKKQILLIKTQILNFLDADFIEKILLDFGIKGKIKKVNNGPVVSLYEFEPAPGIKVSKIVNLSDDIARNTSSISARVSAIPGKKYCWNRNTKSQKRECYFVRNNIM